MQISPLAPDDKKLLRGLADKISGDVLSDDTSRYIYSTDASYHLMVPRGVARPRDIQDLETIARVLHDYNADREPDARMSLIMRSAGTSLTGGSIGRGLIVDVTRHFNQILDLNVDRKTVLVQPGVTYEELSRALLPHGLMFPPNPASGIACELGGMWANNASGTRHVKYGPTRNWVRSIVATTAEGETFKTGPVQASRHWDPVFGDRVQNRWAEELWPLVRDHQDLIARHTPRVNKNSSGYALDHMWKDGQFDLTQLLVGSEGTLALFGEAELALADIVPHRAVVLLFFDAWERAGEAVREVLSLSPVAVEMVDRHLLNIARPRSSIVRDLVPEQTETALLVEFEDYDPGGVEERVNAVVARIVHDRKLAFNHHVAIKKEDQERLWDVRRSAAMIGHLAKGSRKPVPFIEDCVVRPEDLPAYIRDISAVFEKHDVRVAYWGHAGNGNIHVRPALDLQSETDLDLMKVLTEEVFAIVDRYEGSYTAEHGDGYTHAHLLARKFGDLYPLYERVKAFCDPLGFLNPDKIISRLKDPLTTDLRMGPADRIHTEAENEVVSDPVAIMHIDNCVGLGVCKDFCPSFIGTRSEADLTRGRTNAMRGMMLGAFGDPDAYLRTKEFRALGDTCLNCKRCAFECPSQVDEPRHLLAARRYVVKKEGMPLLNRLFANYENLAKWGVRLHTVVNFAQKLSIVRAAMEVTLGVDRRRSLPSFAPEVLDDWYRRRGSKGAAQRGDAVYFPGCFGRFNQPVSVGRNTIRMLELMEYKVVIPETRCSGHALETYGGDLTSTARHNIIALERASCDDAPILTTCSSCRLSLVKQYPEWFWNDPEWKQRAEKIADRVVDAAHFGASGLSSVAPTDHKEHIAYHAPCHSMALSSFGHPGGDEALRRADGRAHFHEVQQCCSGMGGTFGFKRSNRQIMEANADRMITHLGDLPEDTTVYTDCPSCRLALDEKAPYRSDHPVNAVYRWLRAESGQTEKET